MKHSTDSINEITFIHFPQHATDFSTGKGRLYTTAARCFAWLRNRILVYKDALRNILSAMGIGIGLLITVYFYLIQLAEYGWQ